MPHLRINDVELFYEFQGQPAGQTVVFINGLLTDTSSWAPIVPFFAARYRCLLYDCRGQGRSAKPDHSYETQLHAADLAALIEALAIERPYLVGLSNGGAAALQVAAAQPETVAALAVCGSYARVDTALQVKLTSWLRAMESGGSPLRFDVATPWVWGAQFLEQHYERLLPFREKGLSLPSQPAHNLIAGALIHDVQAELGRISAPTLVIVGEDDLLTPPAMARAISAGVQHGHMQVMSGAGHAAALEQPELFARAVLAFSQRLKQGRANANHQRRRSPGCV